MGLVVRGVADCMVGGSARWSFGEFVGLVVTNVFGRLVSITVRGSMGVDFGIEGR